MTKYLLPLFSVIAVESPPRTSAGGGRGWQARLPSLLRFAAWIGRGARSSTNHRTSIAGDAFLERALDAAIAVADTDIHGTCGRCRVSRYQTLHPTYARSAACRQSMQTARHSGLRMIDTLVKVS